MNWKKIIELWTKNSAKYVLPEGISDAELAKLRVETNFDWPCEFVEFYRSYNGIGRTDDSENCVEWIFMPSDQIAAFCNAIRDQFAKTHGIIADNFFPFYTADYSCGNAIGYLRLNGNISDKLYLYNHEDYCYKNEQSWDDFLMPLNSNIHEYIVLMAEVESRLYPTTESKISDEISVSADARPSLPGQENIDEIIKQWG